MAAPPVVATATAPPTTPTVHTVNPFTGSYSASSVAITYSFNASGYPKVNGVTFAQSGSGPASNFQLQYRCSGSSTWSVYHSFTWGSATGQTGPASGTFTCTAGGLVEQLRLNSPSGYQSVPANGVVDEWTVATSDASTCTGFAVAGSSASYVGTTFSALVKWTGTAPAGGWKVYAPGSAYAPASGTTPTLSVSTAGTTTPGEFIASATVAGLGAAASARIEKATDPTCYVVVSVATSAVSTSPTDNGTTDTGEDCGINVFCTFKAALAWVFVPDESATDNLSDTFDGLSEKFPFGTVATFSDWFSLIAGCASADVDTAFATSCGQVDLAFTVPGTVVTGPATSYVIADEAQPERETQFMTTLHSFRGTLNTLVWAVFVGGLAWAVYRWATPFGVLHAWSVNKEKS